MDKKILLVLSFFIFSTFFVPYVLPKENKKPSSTSNSNYLIGAGDILKIQVWREPKLSGEFIVRPDGKITFPLVNDVQAQSKTPFQLKQILEKELSRFITAPVVTVVVQKVNSKNIYVLGKVNNPGKYPLTGPTTVLQALAEAGGLAEWAKADEIVIVRNEGGKQIKIDFDYDKVSKGEKLDQNIFLKPGDTIIVP